MMSGRATQPSRRSHSTACGHSPPPIRSRSVCRSAGRWSTAGNGADAHPSRRGGEHDPLGCLPGLQSRDQDRRAPFRRSASSRPEHRRRPDRPMPVGTGPASRLHRQPGLLNLRGPAQRSEQRRHGHRRGSVELRTPWTPVRAMEYGVDHGPVVGSDRAGSFESHHGDQVSPGRVRHRAHGGVHTQPADQYSQVQQCRAAGQHQFPVLGVGQRRQVAMQLDRVRCAMPGPGRVGRRSWPPPPLPP